MASVLPLNALPVGYRFSPTDEELVNHFLRSKINGNEEAVGGIPVVDLCKSEPWELPGKSRIETNDDKWIFFCRNYRNGKRPNRATRTGYWKATGRDRSIKSVKGTTVIGTKKTLVFYTGRSPKGLRTNWVIHEYCATSEELHGTNPGQGSFVLFKLIKKHDEKLETKQDESTEGLNRNEVDENVSSPATVISFMPSELVTPTTTVQAEKLPSFNSVSGLVENSESIQDNCVADELDCEWWRHLADPEPPDNFWKIFSPLRLQMQTDLESMDTLHCPVSNDVGPDHNEFQYGTNDQDINEYLVAEMMAPKSINVLNRVFPNEYTGSCSESDEEEDTGSFGESDEEVAQAQFDPEQFEQNYERKAPVFMAMPAGAYRTPDISNEEHLSPEGSSSNGDAFGTGIKSSTHQPRAKNFWPRGTTPGRIRLQQELHVQSSYHSNFRDLFYKEEDHEAKLIASKAEEAEEKHSATADPAAIIDETEDTSLSKSNKKHLSYLGLLENEFVELSFVSVSCASDQFCDLFNSPEGSSNAVKNIDTFGTGIKLKTRQAQDQPSAKNFGPEGNAPRRIWLQKKLQVRLSYHSNFRELSDKEENHEAKIVVAKLKSLSAKLAYRL